MGILKKCLGGGHNQNVSPQTMGLHPTFFLVTTQDEDFQGPFFGGFNDHSGLLWPLYGYIVSFWWGPVERRQKSTPMAGSQKADGSSDSGCGVGGRWLVWMTLNSLGFGM